MGRLLPLIISSFNSLYECHLGKHDKTISTTTAYIHHPLFFIHSSKDPFTLFSSLWDLLFSCSHKLNYGTIYHRIWYLYDMVAMVSTYHINIWFHFSLEFVPCVLSLHLSIRDNQFPYVTSPATLTLLKGNKTIKCWQTKKMHPKEQTAWERGGHNFPSVFHLHCLTNLKEPELLYFSSWLVTRVAEPSDYKTAGNRCSLGGLQDVGSSSLSWPTQENIALLGILGKKRFEAGPVLLLPKIQRTRGLKTLWAVLVHPLQARLNNTTVPDKHWGKGRRCQGGLTPRGTAPSTSPKATCCSEH